MNEKWVDKYRPRIFDDIVGNQAVIDRIRANINNLPDLLFYGRAGIGKTTLAKVIIDTLQTDYIELNASDERGIAIIQGRVKDFAKTQGLSNKIKIVLLDEADNLCLPPNTEIIINTLENPKIIKLENLNENELINIPSFNIETKELENDRGKLIDSGEAVFYEIELEDGRKIIASENHPFFDKNLIEKKVIDLEIGNEIIDLSNKIIHKCPVCENITTNKVTCSKKCANKLHSIKMNGKNNPSFGKIAWNKGLTKYDDERVAKQASIGEKNGNHKINGGFQRYCFWKEATEEQKNKCRKAISDGSKGKVYDYYNRAIRSVYGLKGFKDCHYRRYIPNKKEIECGCCHEMIKSNGRDGIYVHHIDKNNKNNNKENLMFVCPYCHNMVLHDCLIRFLEMGWKITHNR